MPTSPASRAPTGVLPSSPGAAPITPTPGVSPPVASQLGPQAQLLEGGQIIARIDGQTVLAGDVLWQVNQLVEANRDRIGPGQEAAFRDMLLKRQLLTIIDTKLLYADFKRTVPAENLPQVQETLAEGFRDREIPRLIKVLGLETQPELEAKLESYGTNLRDARQRFTENAIAGEWLRQRTPKPKEITHHEMLTYYQEHLTDYDYPAKARWEELMIRFDRVGGDKNRAWRELAELGNQVWSNVVADRNIRGSVFTEIAKQHSHGHTAEEGGQHDWTTIGALKCEAINEGLRNLKVGQLSDGIASEKGYHIIRVLDRKEAGRTPFTEAQADIRELLVKKQRQKLVNGEIQKLRENASVWTIFHGDLTASRLNDLLDGPQRR